MSAGDFAVSTEDDVIAVVAAAGHLAPLPQRGNRWAHLTLCVLDAVFSISARYDTTCRTVHDYATHVGLAHVLEPADRVEAGAFIPTEEPVAALRQRIEEQGPDEFARVVLRNRQRTSARGGVLKAEAAREYAVILDQHGLHRLPDVAALLAHEVQLRAVETDLAQVPGHGAYGIRTGYLWMLAGSDDLIKPDRMVLGWLAAVLGRTPSVPEARILVRAAASELGATAWQLDHAIWAAQRGQRRRPAQPAHLGGATRQGLRLERRLVGRER
ncbi:heme peroxidase [Microlunatus lacustris]